MADEVTMVEAAGREVPITSPGKVLFAERGETKLDLARYYQDVEEPLQVIRKEERPKDWCGLAVCPNISSPRHGFAVIALHG